MSAPDTPVPDEEPEQGAIAADAAAVTDSEFGIALHPRPPWDRPDQRAQNPALYDPLTLLPNRALLLDRLSMALTRTHRTGEPLAVVLCEINEVDDLLAHAGRDALDTVLIAVSRRLEQSVRTTDTVARGVADQFILLCERLSQADDITVVLHRVHGTMRTPLTVERTERTLSVSLGAVITNDPMLEFDELIDEAEDLLDRAREAGPGRSAVSDWSFQIFGQAAAVLDQRDD
jgi:diguanylate cyclase (GGDEF)-like protein